MHGFGSHGSQPGPGQVEPPSVVPPSAPGSDEQLQAARSRARREGRTRRAIAAESTGSARPRFPARTNRRALTSKSGTDRRSERPMFAIQSLQRGRIIVLRMSGSIEEDELKRLAAAYRGATD